MTEREPARGKRKRDALSDLIGTDKVAVNRGPLLLLLGALKVLHDHDGPDLSEIAEMLFADDLGEL